MIDFRVKSSGVILDIAPDASFQIEYENPMFSDDRCPLAFSTEISFLPTQKNKEQLGYLAAMMLTPSVKELDVEVYASGIKILDGMLRFSSVKDGILNYTFAGRSLEDDWSGKIYEKEILFVPGNAAQQAELIFDIVKGEVEGVFAPILVNDTETDKLAIFHEDPGFSESEVAYDVKYHNYPAADEDMVYEPRSFTPAISVLKILEDELLDVEISNSAIEDMLEYTAIIGQYKTDYTTTPSGIPATGLDVARTLPDISSLELLRIVLKMFCCALFRNMDKFVMKNIGDVIGSSSDVLDWDEKISGTAESSVRPAGGYRFSYANGADEEYSPKEGYTVTETFINLDDIIPEQDVYFAFKHAMTGLVISAREVSVKKTRGEFSHYLSDLLSMDTKNYDFQPVDNDGEVFDSSVEAKLVRATPDRLITGDDSLTMLPWFMAAIINPETIGDKRGSDVLVGKIRNLNQQTQITDGSMSYYYNEEVHSENKRLTPEALFDLYHDTFADWCRNSHQVVISDLKLSMTDIASFRMWQKVAFAGRTWFVKKLTVTFYAAIDRTEVTGEFVSVN